MNSSRANRRILVVVAAGAVLVLAGVLGRLGPARWLYDHTLLPVGSGLTSLGATTSEAISNLGRVKDLARDNAALEQENAQLRKRLASDAETKRDNELLRGQLGLDVAGAPREVSADVISFQPDSYRQFLTINKGGNSGIKSGMAVLSGGVLIGTIADTQPTTARIMLVTDPEFKLTAKDQDTNATGIIQGQLGSGLILDKIGQTDTVKPGDTVTSSGLGGLVPPGLFIGQVQSVDTRADIVFQSARVETTIKANQLRFAFVVLGQ
jgi:rod shape-determining protein MreC